MAAGGVDAQILGGETKAPRRQQRRVFRLGAAAAAAGRARDVGTSRDGSGSSVNAAFVNCDAVTAAANFELAIMASKWQAHAPTTAAGLRNISRGEAAGI